MGLTSLLFYALLATVSGHQSARVQILAAGGQGRLAPWNSSLEQEPVGSTKIPGDHHFQDPRLTAEKRWTWGIQVMIISMLVLYATGALATMLRFCSLVVKTESWEPCILPAVAGFAFIPIGLAGGFAFFEPGTCSYSNTSVNFLIPVSDLSTCHDSGPDFNVPEFLLKFTSVTAALGCVYFQRLYGYLKAHLSEQPVRYLVGCELLRICGVLAMIGLAGLSWVPGHTSHRWHKIFAYIFFLFSIWMLLIHGRLTNALPPETRMDFLSSAALGGLLWVAMTAYGVLYSINFCDKLCGGDDSSGELEGTRLLRGYRWCLSMQNCTEWVLVAMFAFWILLAPACSATASVTSERKEADAVSTSPTPA